MTMLTAHLCVSAILLVALYIVILSMIALVGIAPITKASSNHRKEFSAEARYFWDIEYTQKIRKIIGWMCFVSAPALVIIAAIMSASYS